MPSNQATIINIKNAPYNADGSSTTNATSAIQRAIDFLNNNGGGCLKFPQGIYNFKPESPVLLETNITLMGLGGAKIVSSKNGVTLFSTKKSQSLSCAPSLNIHNLLFKGPVNSANHSDSFVVGPGADKENAVTLNRLNLSGVEISLFSSFSSLQKANGRTGIRVLSIANSVFEQNDYSGVSGGAEAVFIHSCKFIKNGNARATNASKTHGIYLNNFDSASFIGNHFNGNYGWGIHLYTESNTEYSMKNILIAGNQFSLNGFGDITFGYPKAVDKKFQIDNVVILNNSFGHTADHAYTFVNSGIVNGVVGENNEFIQSE